MQTNASDQLNLSAATYGPFALKLVRSKFDKTNFEPLNLTEIYSN